MRSLRLVKILRVALKYGLDEFLLGHERFHWLRPTARAVTFWRDVSSPRAVRLRLALQDLGPIFVKFGQMLSTRRDLLPTDIADELAKLQDQVPPFPSEQVMATLERVYAKPVDQRIQVVRSRPGRQRLGCASPSGRASRRHAGRGQDPAARASPKRSTRTSRLMQMGAMLMEKLWSDGKRLKPRAVVAEFDRTIHDELDLSREAANCSQLRRNFARSPLLLVPEVYWDWCNSEVMVMQRMEGTPISHRARLVEQGIDIKRLARAGVEIFFTQVFRDGFFHADMHPGNIFVAIDAANRGKYIALDFGIMGTLSDQDKSYLAQNFLAFFRRDYRRVATAHIESGWVPPDTRVDELEAEIRVVCEPIFDRPLKEISLGPDSGAAVQGVAPVQCRDPAAARAAAEDAAQCRGPGPGARSRSRSLGHRQAVPRALDARSDRLARSRAAPARRGAVSGDRAAAAAEADLPAAQQSAVGIGDCDP